jgi:DNA-binding IscR family transcriptional regulator
VKISKRGEYALRALIDFGLAEAADRPLLQMSELALRGFSRHISGANSDAA